MNENISVWEAAQTHPHKLDHSRQLITEGKETKAGAAALLGVDAVTLRRALKMGA